MKPGAFVRVRQDHPSESRRGRDGMVVGVNTDGSVGLVFYADRYNRAQGCTCVGPELWYPHELDPTTVE